MDLTDKTPLQNTQAMQDYLFSLGFKWSTPPREGKYKILSEGCIKVRLRDQTMWNGKYLDNHENPVTLEQLRETQPTIQETPMSNALSKYTNVNFATPTLFRGQCVTDFNKASYMSLIRDLNTEIESYSDIKNSTAIDNIVTGLKKDLKKLTELFDTFMESK